MSRPSRGEQREQRRAGHPVAPVDVHVTSASTASVGGVPVVTPPGGDIQQAVVDHLRRLAAAQGRPVLATIHDALIGYVVPLEADPDGSTRVTGTPVALAVPGSPVAPAVPGSPVATPVPGSLVVGGPGTVRPPTGTFGPPPAMPTAPAPAAPVPPAPAPAAPVPPAPAPAAPPVARPSRLVAPPVAQPSPPVAPPVAPPTRPSAPPSVPSLAPSVDPKPVPVLGFDAVAEAVLGEDTAGVGAGTLRVYEAVRAGLVETAAQLVEPAVAEGAVRLGSAHPEVLHLRELSAYVAYLGGEPARAFQVALDVARVRRGAGDMEGAYSGVQSAATAWRAVRDPEQGLGLGRDLIALWAELTAWQGPAADDVEELESARARMGRLTERAARARA
ncbi:tetratricopeptide repeat protein [Streptomyces sp. V3I7]|uniref:tetratricopeptide repeat protein n=1 Tax=Streptomyces sp. V3I7 TaxID=3042278 RepID=UPI0027D79BE0|nr:tetratricopeptide repeat protein [Streptomyces sp. V3I7]